MAQQAGDTGLDHVEGVHEILCVAEPWVWNIRSDVAVCVTHQQVYGRCWRGCQSMQGVQMVAGHPEEKVEALEIVKRDEACMMRGHGDTASFEFNQGTPVGRSTQLFAADGSAIDDDLQASLGSLVLQQCMGSRGTTDIASADEQD